MNTQVKGKFIRMSPRKIRLVADLVRGLDVEKALVRLQFLRKDAVTPVMKLLRSAISNAEENFNLKRNNLFIKSIQVDGGPTLKRWKPRAFGRATPIRKRTAHIVIILGERVETPEEEINKNKETKKSADNLVKIEDMDKIKLIEKEEGGKDKEKEEKPGAESGFASRGKAKKGFAGRIFNRRSGTK